VFVGNYGMPLRIKCFDVITDTYLNMFTILGPIKGVQTNSEKDGLLVSIANFGCYDRKLFGSTGQHCRFNSSLPFYNGDIE
jgi:hypothetical protein